MSIRTRLRTTLAAGRLLCAAVIAAGLIPVPASAQVSTPESDTTQQVAPGTQPKPRRERVVKGDATRSRKPPDTRSTMPQEP